MASCAGRGHRAHTGREGNTMSTEVAVAADATMSRFEASLAAEHDAERDLLKSLARSIVLTMPVTIAIFVFIAAVAISDKAEWYVWLGARRRPRRDRRPAHGLAGGRDDQRAQARRRR